MIDMSGSGALFGTSGLSPLHQHRHGNLYRVFATERLLVVQHFYHQDCETVHVHLLVVRQVVGGQQLGSHVLRRANSTAQCHRFLFHFRQSKVS